MVMQLAEFEKAHDEVVTTAEIYMKDGFDDKRFEALIAEADNATDGDNVVGMALYFWAYSTWRGKFIWLEDLIVNEKYRHCGIGKLLFEAVIAEAHKKGAMQVKWQVLDWNKPAIQFYEKYKAICDNEWLSYRLTRNEMEKIVFKNG